MRRRLSEIEKIAMKLATGMGVPVAEVADGMKRSKPTIYRIIGKRNGKSKTK